MNYLNWNPASILPPLNQLIVWHGPNGEHVSGFIRKMEKISGGIPVATEEIEFVTEAGKVIKYLPSSWRFESGIRLSRSEFASLPTD